MTPRPCASYASAVWVLIGLGAGGLLGVVASAFASPSLLAAVRAVEPVGTIFVNAIRMAVVPLVVASLVAGIVSISDARSLTRLGARSLVVFVALAFAAAVFATAIAAPVLAHLDINPAVADTLRQPASAAPPAPAAAAPGFAQWLSDLVPSNPISGPTWTVENQQKILLNYWSAIDKVLADGNEEVTVLFKTNGLL